MFGTSAGTHPHMHLPCTLPPGPIHRRAIQILLVPRLPERAARRGRQPRGRPRRHSRDGRRWRRSRRPGLVGARRQRPMPRHYCFEGSKRKRFRYVLNRLGKTTDLGVGVADLGVNQFLAQFWVWAVARVYEHTRHSHDHIGTPLTCVHRFRGVAPCGAPGLSGALADTSQMM